MTQLASELTSASAAIAVDVGGTDIKYGVVTREGQLSQQGTRPTPRGTDAIISAVAEIVAEVSQQVAAAAGLASAPALPVGVVVPGIVDEQTGEAKLSVNLGWRDVPMRQRLSAAVGRPVAFGHDVRGGAAAEMRWGAAQGAENALFVALGTGIGGALIVRGQPFAGGGYAGEIGQILVTDPHGGGRERLEAIASAAAIERRYAERTGTAPAGALPVFQAAAAGDETARAVVDEALDTLAETLATVVGTLGELTLIVGGGLANGPEEEFVGPLRDRLSQLLTVAPVPPTVRASLGKWAGCLGAAVYAFLAGETE